MQHGIVSVEVRAEHRALPKKRQTVAGRGQKGGVGQMQNFGNGIPVAHTQQHDFALVARLLAGFGAPHRKAHAFTGLGLSSKADAQTAHRQCFQHKPALLQDAGKRHDAPLAETVARSPGSGLTRNIRSQPGSGHEQPGLLIHAKPHFCSLHVLRIQGVPGAQAWSHTLFCQGRHGTQRLHAGQHGAGQLMACATPAGGKQKRHFVRSHPRGKHV